MDIDARGRLLSPAEAAEALGVHVKTLTRWADRRLISIIRTPGGHRRYWENEIIAIRDGEEKTEHLGGLGAPSANTVQEETGEQR